MKITCPVCKKESENASKYCTFCGHYFSQDEHQTIGIDETNEVTPPISTPPHDTPKSSKKVLVLLITLIISLIATITAIAIGIAPHISNAFDDAKQSFKDGWNDATFDDETEHEITTYPKLVQEQTQETLLTMNEFPQDSYDIDTYCVNIASEEYRGYEEVIAKFAYSLETSDYKAYKEIFADFDTNLYTKEDIMSSLQDSRQELIDNAGLDFICYAVINEEDRISIADAQEIQDFLDENNIDLDVLDCYNLNFTLNILSENEEDFEDEYDVSVYETQDGWYMF